MSDGSSKPTVVVTGASGNLGSRLLAQLQDFRICAVDMVKPATELPIQFESMDLGEEGSCQEMVKLLKQSRARAVVHLAFVIDPLRTGVIDVERMWRINVAGTARVMEAITEVNRSGGSVEQFIFPSSVSAYGPELPVPVNEDHPLGAYGLPYAVHKQECDDVVRYRAGQLGFCSTYVLRPHIFAGATVQNYLIGVLRGTPTGKGRLARRLRAKRIRLPILLPFGEQYLIKRCQFVHVDDMARLIAYILHQPVHGNSLTVLNVAGRGESVTIQRCARLSNAKITRLPGRWMCRLALKIAWDLGISGVPPEALPYMIGSYTMDTSRLRAFLGKDYENVIQYTIESALRDSFTQPEAAKSDKDVKTTTTA